MRVLAGDVGGTKTLLALCEVSDGVVSVITSARYTSATYARLEDMLRAFRDAQPLDGVRAACLGVAGPVEDERCRATNLPWHIDAREVATAIGLPSARLVNDFFAAASGVESLAPHELVTLQPGSPIADAPRVLIGAGTGLGEALLVPHDARWICVPGEGGHTDFAPSNERERGLARWLAERHGRVSWERVVSGLGIPEIYEFLRDIEGLSESAELAAALRGGDPGAVIGGRALVGGDALCDETIALFLGAYGAEAGNAALRVLARGGVYLAGGIAAKLLPLLARGPFLSRFCDKGRMSALARSMPVHVVTEAALGLRGAALIAALTPTRGALGS